MVLGAAVTETSGVPSVLTGEPLTNPLDGEYGIIDRRATSRFEGKAAATERTRAPEPPLTGEPLALDLVNTTFVRGGLRGGVVDALAGPQDLDRWLEAHRDVLPDGLARRAVAVTATERHVREFHRLRDALRELSRACVTGEPYTREAAGVINDAVPLALYWHELGPASEAGPVVRWAEPDGHLAALGAVAASGVDLLTGERRLDVRACAAPGCILYFVKSHPRREWCTPGCGNRVRVARHQGRLRP
ncbi:hypothetical protein GQS52_18325 [Streptomyces sp. SCUT-3]|nr:hypothetical protein C0036_17985 [Streptomyces sp. DJ]QMV23400.1 hypothetical protein GQS52_18325 [Streptomyces sp. SCUT-3]